VHERRLAGPGHAGHDAEDAERDVDVDVPQVVRVGATDLKMSGRRTDHVLERRPMVEVRP